MSVTSPADVKQIDEFRYQMPMTDSWAYFDHAAVAPLSGPAQQAVVAWAQQAAEQGEAVWPQWALRVQQMRQRAAEMLGAEAEEIALVHNTTTGISLIAEGFPWQEGDNIVTLADEFPSNQYPWLNLSARGVETRRVETELGRLDLNRLEDALDERTRMISISWVGYATGYRHDLDAVAEIAQQHGALVMVDGIQAFGVFELDVRRTRIDFLAADAHKWQLGPEGSAILYLRREHLDRLHTIGVGWNSVVQTDFNHIELNLKPTAERYEGGSQNMVGVIAHGASLDLLAGFGTEWLSRRVLEVTDHICVRLAEIGAQVVSHREGEHRSGIVAFELPGRDPNVVRKYCFSQQVVLNCRAGRLRVSPHAYTNDEDIDRLIVALGSAPK